MILTGMNRSTVSITCPRATFSNTNLTWADLASNPVLSGESPATKSLSHGTVL